MENKDAVSSWKKRAYQFQDGMYNLLRDRAWDVIWTEEMLKSKIGFALFGLVNENCDGNYTDEREKCITAVKNQFINLWNKAVSDSTDKPDGIYFGCVMVYLYLDNEKEDAIEVLFKVPKLVGDKLDCYFIDRSGRTYTNWNDFLKANNLPKCYMCYPINGRYKVSAYNDVFKIGFQKSPACKIIKSVLTCVDVGSSVVTVAATTVEVAALFCPVTAPIVIASGVALTATSIYGASRSTAKLVDKAIHKESIGLEDSESRRAWLGFAANATSAVAASGAAIARGVVLYKGVGAISRGGVIALRICNVSSVATNGINVINSLITIIVKYSRGTLTRSDIKHFALACFFFVNAIVSYQNAERLIEEFASNDLTNFFPNARTSTSVFIKSLKRFMGDDIDLLRRNVFGPISELIPNYNVVRMDRSVIRLTTVIRDYFSGSISTTKFVTELIDALGDIWRAYGHVFKYAIRKLISLVRDVKFNFDDKKSGCKLLLNSSPEFARKFCLEIQKTIDYCNLYHNVDEFEKDIIDLINDIPDCQTENAMELLSKTQFVCELITIEFDKIKQVRQSDLENVEDKNVSFFKLTIEKLRISSNEIASAYSEFKSNLPRPENNALMNTSTSSCYAYSFPVGFQGSTEQQFWQKANEITNADLNDENATIFIRKEVVWIRPNERGDVKAVLFFNFSDCISEWGLMSVLKNA